MRRTALCLVWGMCVLYGAAGCPTYEDTYSGTYRESDVDPLTASRAIEVDLFRFGNNVSAILRFYEPDVPDEEPFARERFCTWTDGAAFDSNDRSFDLPIESGSRIPESELSGKLVSNDRLELTVTAEEDGASVIETRELERISDEPNENCDSIGTLFIRPLFDLRGDRRNVMSMDAGYDVENPVFSVQWVGVETEGDFFLNTSAQGPTRRLGGREFVDGSPGRGEPDELRDNLSLKVPAPPENIWIESGQTSYAIGHPVVIDDDSEEGSFSWNPENEPIVASALQIGVPVDRDYDGPGIGGSGKALLFVRGSLSELGEGFRNARFEDPEAIARGSVPESHFYVVEIIYDETVGAIREMSLPKSLQEHEQNRDIPIKMTTQFLGEDAPTLPRISPRE